MAQTNIKHRLLSIIFKNKMTIYQTLYKLFFYWLPIKKNKIIFSNHGGKGYGCNPKYIAEEIIKQKLDVELVWFIKPELADAKDFPKEIKLVSYYNYFAYMYEFATSKVWIDNIRKNRDIKKGIVKKRGQFYINTWHGSLGIKKLDADFDLFAKNKQYKDVSEKDSTMIDVMLSNSDFETNVFQTSLWYNHKIEKIGHPRNDIFFNITDNKKGEIKQKLNIDKDTKILLYIPSWRDNLRIDCYSVDYKRLRQTLEHKTNQKWNILTRFHPNNIPKLNYLLKDNSIDLDVTLYSDTQELLAISDIIISDYSSCMFDFMLTKNPCFVYATDIEQYDNERGFYYPLNSTPFPIARNNNELIENIQNFDNNLYKTKCEEFLKEKNSIDDGYASKRAVELIKDVIELQ